MPSRQRQNDDKWKHGLYDNDEEPQVSNPKGGERDLRLKLQKKGCRHLYESVKRSSARASHDLHNELSGSMHAQPVNNELRQPKEAVEAPKTSMKNVSVEAPAPETKKASNPVSRKKSQQKIDMTALIHMTNEDLKDLGIPMGPRKKIILALDSRA